LKAWVRQSSRYMIDDEAFLAEFEACRWPMDQWHHQQHFKLAYLYLRRYPLDAAMDRIRERIKAHNAAHNSEDLMPPPPAPLNGDARRAIAGN
jgi:hypothetical protein